jgi:hypothetical protein
MSLSGVLNIIREVELAERGVKFAPKKSHTL